MGGVAHSLVTLDNYDDYVKNLQITSVEFGQYEKPELINAFIEKIAARKKTTIKYNLGYELNSPRVQNLWTAFKVSALVIVSIFALSILYCARKILLGRKIPKAKSQ